MTARQTAQELGDSVTAYELDVTSRESVAGFLDAVEAEVGPLDVMINNAGIMPPAPSWTSPTRAPSASSTSTCTA